MVVEDFFPDDEYGGALLIRTVEPHEANGFKIGAMSKALMEPGSDAASKANQLRYFSQNDLIRPHEKIGSGRTAHNLYKLDQILIAAILARILEFGTADMEPLRWASVALQLRGDFDGGYASPAMWCIKGHLMGLDGFVFELATYRHRKDGNRQMRARVRNTFTDEGTDFEMGPENQWEKRSVFRLDLTPVLNRIFGTKEQRALRFAKAQGGAH